MASESSRLRVLCLDGGGIRGLSEVLILKELMLQVQIHNGLPYVPEPCQCFDFIVGTSTGGLLAILLGRLGRTIAECESLYRDLGSSIFEGSQRTPVFKESRYTGVGLKEAIETMAGDQSLYDAELSKTGNTRVPVAVVAVAKSTGASHLFRSYGARSKIERCSVVQACLATSAATTFFPSVTINGVQYVDGAFRANNPSYAALAEMESIEAPLRLPDAVAGVGCFVSVEPDEPRSRTRK